MNEATTKERILDAAEGLMLDKSFHSVGLNEILAAVNVPKGSFYHHFKSKEQFGVELLEHYVANSTAYRKKVLLADKPEPNPLLRLFSFFDGGIAKMLHSQGKCGCLVNKLSAEIADFSEPMREVLAAGNREWIRILETLIESGMRQGVISKRLEPAQAAALVQDLWTGAMQRACIERSVTPLRDALAFLRTLLQP